MTHGKFCFDKRGKDSFTDIPLIVFGFVWLRVQDVPEYTPDPLLTDSSPEIFSILKKGKKPVTIFENFPDRLIVHDR